MLTCISATDRGSVFFAYLFSDSLVFLSDLGHLFGGGFLSRSLQDFFTKI